jgi:hypothetical protein
VKGKSVNATNHSGFTLNVCDMFSYFIAGKVFYRLCTVTIATHSGHVQSQRHD